MSIKEKWVYKDKVDVIIDSISLSGNQCQLNNIFQKFSLSIDGNEIMSYTYFQIFKNIDLTENDKKYTFYYSKFYPCSN